MAAASGGLGEGAKERFAEVQTPDGALCQCDGDVDRLQVTWLHLSYWAPYPMCRALDSEVRAPGWQWRHTSALLNPEGEERQALTS